jgi:UTP--glucose-1-phosphate uridylyltransferase
LAKAVELMRQTNQPESAIATFRANYHALAAGATGVIAETEIEPLAEVPHLDSVEVGETAQTAALAQTVVIRLNGGLGTSMGLAGPKSLLEVRESKNFLDLIVAQVLHARRTYGVRLPLLFMDSFHTAAPTLAHLANYPSLPVAGLPLDFLQSAEPKLTVADLEPVAYPADPELEWCPPGHGDLYPALWADGLLGRLLAAGYRYAFVANGDNLGAVPDPKLAGWFAASGAPFAAEVCARTANDRKGGHLAIRKADGQLVLRESAQTAPEDLPAFEDVARHHFFNTNNLWLDLAALADRLEACGGVLGLPLIRNVKTVNPADPDSAPVYQLETAMGAAISVFAGARVIEVGRDRFLPVKSTAELLLLRSDVFSLEADGRFRLAAPAIPPIKLAEQYYQLLGGFEPRFAAVPSLRHCTGLEIDGDWSFPTAAEIVGPLELPEVTSPASYPVDYLRLHGLSPAQFLAQQEATRAELGIVASEAVPPSGRTELNADERRLLSDVPPHW